MASRTCKLKSCGNVLSANSPHEYCYAHRSLSVSTIDPGRTDSIIESAPELLTTGSLRTPEVARIGETLSEATPIHHSYSAAIADACKSWNESLSQDATIPQMGASLEHDPRTIYKFKEHLMKAGISEERITIWRFSGGHRMDPKSGVKQSFGGETHEAIILDKYTNNEVVIDPSVSKYAPVRDFTAPVDDQLPSGLTPFSDSPWIGSLEEYMNGSFLGWSHREQIG